MYTPIWNPPYFGGQLPNSLIFWGPDALSPNAQMGKEAECETTDQNTATRRNATERRGTLRNLTERLNLDIPHFNLPYFGGLLPNSLIFLAPNAPLPNAQLGKAAKYETTDQTKGRRRTPRNATGRYVT